MKLRFHLIILTAFLLTAGALAEDVFLLSTTNDQDSRVESLLLRLDSEGQPSFLVQRREGKTDRLYTTTDLQNGIVLRKTSGSEVLRLKTQKWHPSRGGVVTLDYLYSVVPPAVRRSLSFQLVRKQKEWLLYTEDNKNPIKSIHFVANVTTIFGYSKALGIEKIELTR